MPTTDRVQIQIDMQSEAFSDLDFEAKAVTGRVIRLSTLFVDALHQALRPFNLTPMQYAIIAVLRASGEPYVLSPSAIRNYLILTSGGMTNLLHSLEELDLVHRKPDPNDGRGVLVRLTKKGRSLAEAAIREHIPVEHELLSSLNKQECVQLEKLLTKLLRALDPVPDQM